LAYHPKASEVNERSLQFMVRHVDSLFAFLRYSGADATSWQSEQAIRLACIKRSLCQTSHT
jgi:hypothetical protein